MIIGSNNKSHCDLAAYLILLYFFILLVNVLIRIWSPLTFLNLGFLYVILRTFIQLLWTLLFH